MCTLCLQGPLLMDQPVSALAWQLQLAHSLPLLQVGTSNCYFSCSDAAGIMSLFGMLFESFWHFSGVGAMTKMRQPHDSHPFMQTSSKFQASIQASQCNQHRRHSFTSPSVLRQNQHVSLRSGCWNNLVFWITTCNSSLAPRHRWSLRTLSTTKKLTKGTNLNAVWKFQISWYMLILVLQFRLRLHARKHKALPQANSSAARKGRRPATDSRPTWNWPNTTPHSDSGTEATLTSK